MNAATVIDDRYELKARLFSEGNQAAYAARDREQNTDVLLFLVPTSEKLDEKADRAVRADVELAFQAEAPTLVPLLDFKEADGFRFLTMPMPHGSNAWTRITQKAAGGKTFSQEAALRAADDLIAAATAAQRRNTILGFSPKQVWIDENGVAEVQYYWLERVYLDRADGQSTGTGIKTLGVEGGYFQAPELASGQGDATRAADQFFIAAILYGLLTGEVPGGTLAPIRNTRRDVPKPFANAIEKALAPSPEKRHADLRAFRHALHKRPASKRQLIPLLLLLTGLWTGWALFAGGADVDDWALPSELERRREEAFLASRATATPVPRPDASAATRFAGIYASTAMDGPLPERDLRLGRDGAFAYVDRSKDDIEYRRGIWWLAPGEADTLVLSPVSAGAERPAPLRARASDGVLHVSSDAAEDAQLAKVAWTQGDEPGSSVGALVPLLRVDSPLSGAVFAQHDVRVSGRVAVTGTQVTVNDEAIPVVGTTFETVLKAPLQGPLDVVIRAGAPDGFRSAIVRRVHVDRAPPGLEASARLEQEDGVWRLRVEGRGSDEGRVVAVSVNDEAVELDAQGKFAYERKGADASAHAFTEVVAVDDAGRATRRLLWPRVAPVRGESLAPLFEKAQSAIEAGRTEEGEKLLREIKEAGGLIEQLPPERLTRLVHSGRAPRVSVDDHPAPPAYFENDGSQEIPLSGAVNWFGPDDELLVAGRATALKSGRFETRVQLPALGPNTVVIQVLRSGKAVATREVEVWLAAPDGKVPEWTGRAVTETQRAASARFGLALGKQNGLGMRFVLIPPGVFTRETADGRRFEVRITRPYYLQVREVTRKAYEDLTGESLPNAWEAAGGNLPLAGADRPATAMGRAAAQRCARTLSKKEGGTYRLPTEAEWELGARAGGMTTTDYWDGQTARMSTWANYADRSIRSLLKRWPKTKLRMEVNDRYPGTWPVGTGRANAYGLRDMLGNAGEWVLDNYAEYDPLEADDPRGPASGSQGVVRGGRFSKLPLAGGVAGREQVRASDKERSIGFRLVLEAEAR